MKKLNLIKRLWTDSHEKLKVRGMQKYCILLLLLFTCVTHVLADTNRTVYCAIDDVTKGNYTLKACANIGDNNTWRIAEMSRVDNATYNGKPIYTATFSEKYGGVDELYFRLYSGDTEKGWSRAYNSWTTYGNFDGKLFIYNASNTGTWDTYKTDKTVYWVNMENKEGTPKIHLWNGESTTYPGNEMNNTGKTYQLHAIYTYTTFATNGLFNIGGDAYKTKNLNFGDNNGKMYKGQSGGWIAYVYDHKVNFHANGGSGSMSAQTMPYKIGTALNSNSFTRDGYDFAGWATSSDGSVVYSNGASVTVTDSDLDLYAKWLPQSLTITSHPTYLTTTDKLTLGIDYANIPSGYCYRVKVGAGYYNNSSNQDRDAISGSGSTSFTSYANLPTGNNTVVVELWKNSPFEKQSVVSDGVTVTVEQAYLVNVRAYTDGVESTTGGTVSPASVNASAHLGQTITASTPNTGYDFTGWTANTPNITFADPSALSTTVYATAGGWVYANYVRQSGSYSTTFYAGDHGSINAKGTAIAKNGSASVTIGENETLSATPETGYVFDHWETTGSVSVASETSASTTVTATDAGGTVTAYYRHRPELGAVTATPSGTQNYAGEPINFELKVTSTYMAHPVVVFLVNDGTTEYEVVGAPYGADGSSAAGTIGSDAANTTVHKATFTASAAKSYTVSAKLYEGLLLANFDGKDFTGGTGWEGSHGHDLVTNPSKQAVNGSNNVRRFTKGTNRWDVDLYRFAGANLGISTFRYAHTRQYRTETGKTWLKLNDDKRDLVKDDALSANTWQKVVYDNGAGTPVDFFYPLLAEGNTSVYFDDIILSNEETMMVKASQAATASFSINWNYTVTLNNNGATTAGTESVNVTYGSATGITDITVPTKTGYTFGGYYTADAGAGTLQINASGVWQNAGYVSGGNWNSGSNQTLYAKWTVKNYDITYSPASAPVGVTYTTMPSNADYNTTVNMVITPAADNNIVRVTAVDASSNTVTVTNPSTNTYSFTMPASDVTVSVSVQSLPIVYVMKSKNASCIVPHGFTPTGNEASKLKLWAWSNPGDHNFYSGATWGTRPSPDDVYEDGLHNEWYRFIPDNVDYINESTNYKLILMYNGDGDANRIFASNQSNPNPKSCSDGVNIVTNVTDFSGPVWIIPQGSTGANSAILYTSYPAVLWSLYSNGSKVGDFEKIGEDTYQLTVLASAITNYGAVCFSYNGKNYKLGNCALHTSYYSQATAATLIQDAGNFSWTGSPTGQIILTIFKSSGDWKIYYTPSYQVTYDDNGATTGTVPTDANYYISGTSVTIKGNSGSLDKTGYNFAGWNGNASGTGTDYTPAGTFSISDNTTLYAKWTPKNFSITYKDQGDAAFSGEHASGYPTSHTYNTATALKSASKTGYTFGGWFTSAACTGSAVTELGATDYKADIVLYAKWTINNYTVTLDLDEDNKGTTAGADESASVTYDAAPSTIANRPTAANGYALDGYYTDHNGEGVKVINGDGTWIASVDGYTDGDAKWVHDGDVTLYAYYKKAEITNLVAAPGVIAPGETITITPTIEPTPTGTTKVCYELQYSNGTPLPSQPTFTPGAGDAVSFPVPSASATYIIQAVLETGSTCGSGTELSRRTTTFQVAGAHDVTVKYMCGDLNIKASEVLGEIRPLTWSDDITAPTITGYTFARWDAGDGVTIKDGSGEDKTTSTSSTIKIKAVYDGTLTAVYNKKNMIFFNNTLGWDDVYVYFYTSDKYWDNSYGTGAYKGKEFDYNKQFWDMHYGQMTQIEGTDIWYFDYTARGWDGWANVAFANMDKADSGEDNTSDNVKAFFSNTTSDPIQVVRRGDHVTSLPMFVPLSGQTGVKRNENRAVYYDSGYWMNYPENTGYTLKIYSGTTYGTSDQLQEIPFEFTGDMTLPMSVNVELNASRDYGFEIHRADGTKLGENEYTLVSGNSGDEGQTVRTLGESERSKITTTVAGDYTFKLNYGNSGGYTYLIGVHYPVVVGDYRILYTDDATWSQGAHTGNYSWWHESRTIHKENGATDIVSFYVKKDNDTKMKFQKINSITAGTGAVSWADSVGGTIDISSIKKDGVYNFYLTQANGGISVSKIEPYTGNYYIRTDCAGATRWENFRTTDHQMTYSDYAETNSGYSHYYAHWVEQYTNIKFVIANDYSPCISDTLAADYGTTIANITTSGVEAGKLNSASANIRFMWNQSTNKVSRAYIGGSTNISDRFLVLEGDSKMYDKDGSALNISGLNPNEANLIDDQNFVYEREIQVNTKARAKLTAKYNTNIQYFKGSEGAFAEGTTIELLGGDASGKHTMRIVYDFKTNRLVTAYVPSGTIDAAIAINADLMIVREHQGAGQQLLFEGDGALSEVHTVYGVMRFNRWTLNNKEKTGEHSPVGDPKSIYERSLYWISFPFDVNLSDVFGFGTYGVDWIIEYYDGAERATNGYWIDSDGFWKMVMPAQRADFTLEAGKGYVLAIDVDAMKDNNETFWANNIEQVELFFPSATNVENITQTTAHTIVPEHECTIDRRTDKSVNNINKDRTKADSHWNMIGIPSYANYGATLTSDEAGTHTITWNSNPYTNDLPFLYEWNMTDDSYTVQSGTTYPFKAMHAYMVQYHGDLYWSLASATPPSSIVARRTYAEKLQNVEMRIELQQNEKAVDQTFVKLSNDENVSTNFAFDEDLCKEYNANKANIYTIVENYLPVAGNTMPMSDQTTVVPVGVKIAADGEYTFAIPEGTNGVSVVLIDNIAGTRTNLALSDYTVALGKGDLSDRFMLEIAPIKQMPTGIDAVSDQHSAVRKVMIDGILYIVKDGIVYDAQGHRVQ